MAHFHNYWWFFCLISLKGFEAGKIYVLKIPITDGVDGTSDFNNYVDQKFQQETPQNDERKLHLFLCQNLFDLYKNKEQFIQCLEKLQNKQEHVNQLTSKHNKKQKKGTLNQAGRQHFKPFLDITRFSQDYVDVKDLARSRTDFADEYVDVQDFRIDDNVLPNCKEEFDEFGQVTKTNCLPVLRKNLDIDTSFKVENKGKKTKHVFKDNTNTVESKHQHKHNVETVESKQNNNILRKKKNKRYKVVAKESDVSRSDSSESDKPESDNVVESVETNQISASDSIEVTTKKSKKKTKNSFVDPYMYIQGNKMYRQDDFRRNKIKIISRPGDNLRGGREIMNDFREGNERRGNRGHRFRRSLRLPQFMPKKYHWNEEDFQNLGYYWFNGPKGKYKHWLNR